MEKMTLLQIVQEILSAMNSDDVNSIGDTVEAAQVAMEVRNAFRELFTNREMSTFQSLINLDSPADVTAPHTLTVPTNVERISWLKYRDYDTNSIVQYKDIYYLEPEEFITRIVEQNEDSSGKYQLVKLTASSPVTFPIRTDRAPTFYTIFDEDQTLVFDSFDKAHESFLTSSNSLAWGTIYKTFTLSDSFIPPLDASEFPLLLAEAKSSCFINIKEVGNSKEEARARRQLVRSQTRNTRTTDQRKGALTGVDYSRKRN